MDVNKKLMLRYRIVFFLIGLNLISLGISVSIISNFGVGSWDTVNIGLKNHFGLSIGIWMNICAIGFILFGGLLRKERPKIETFITSLIVGSGTDLYMFLLQDVEIAHYGLSLVLFASSIIIISFGAGMYLVSNLPPNPIDYFMMCIKECFSISIAIAKIILEAIGLLLGLLLGGPVGLGTFIMMFSFGPCIQFFYKKFHQLYRRIEIKHLQ